MHRLLTAQQVVLLELGAATAIRFAEAGAKPVISDINQEAEARVTAKSPSTKVFQEFGQVSILMNNAGTTYRNKPTRNVTEQEFNRVVNFDRKSAFQATRVIVPYLIEKGQGGSIINVASVGAWRPRPGLVWYNASKGAIFNATKDLAGSLSQKGNRFSGICPLLSGTGLFSLFVSAEDTPENRTKFLANVPKGRLAETLEVANAALFFSSDESDLMTRTNLEVDGGRAIG